MEKEILGQTRRSFRNTYYFKCHNYFVLDLDHLANEHYSLIIVF